MSAMVSFLVGYMKMFSEICMYVASWSAIIQGGLFQKPPSVESLTLKEENFHQKFELRKASGSDSQKAVPTPPFQLDLRPCHFSNEFVLMGFYGYNLKGQNVYF